MRYTHMLCGSALPHPPPMGLRAPTRCLSTPPTPPLLRLDSPCGCAESLAQSGVPNRPLESAGECVQARSPHRLRSRHAGPCLTRRRPREPSKRNAVGPPPAAIRSAPQTSARLTPTATRCGCAKSCGPPSQATGMPRATRRGSRTCPCTPPAALPKDMRNTIARTAYAPTS